MNILSFFLMGILSLYLSGCMQSHLSVHTDYLNREHLASYHIGTPDPCLNYPMIGQRLLVQWSLPKNYLNYEDLHIEASIRFGNHTEILENIPITKHDGIYIYTLADEEYWEREGIQTFKIDLYGDNCLIESKKHHLWVKFITVGSDGGTVEKD